MSSITVVIMIMIMTNKMKTAIREAVFGIPEVEIVSSNNLSGRVENPRIRDDCSHDDSKHEH